MRIGVTFLSSGHHIDDVLREDCRFYEVDVRVEVESQ